MKQLKKDVKGIDIKSKKDVIILDMTSEIELEAFYKKYKPKNTYMPAFIPGVDLCETDKKVCEINERGVRNVANACKKHNSKLIFFSSDYIFDGKNGPYSESANANPINEYGRIKFLCEEMVKEVKDYLIIRTTVVYGYEKDSKNFLMTLSNDLMKKMEKNVPNDQMGNPTHVKDLSIITINLVESGMNGIYNVVGPDYCSRYIFALKIARTFGLDEKLIKPIPTEKLNQAAKRPLKGGLIIDKIRKEINANPSGMDIVLNELKPLFKKK